MDNNNKNIFTVGTFSEAFSLKFSNEVIINGDLVTDGKVLHFCTHPQDGCLVGVQGGFLINGGAHFKSSYGNFDLLLESNNNKAWDIAVGTSGDFALYHPASNTTPFKIKENGRVEIGTNNHQGELAVNGTIIAKRHVTTMTGWSDFVLKKDYRLPDLLNEVAPFISAKGHLSGIPTEKEVISNGLDLGDINAKLLTKVEELTLYAIDLQKQTLELKNERTQIYWLIGVLGITMVLLQVWRGKRG